MTAWLLSFYLNYAGFSQYTVIQGINDLKACEALGQRLNNEVFEKHMYEIKCTDYKMAVSN
jgi:hypothetical protein